MRIVLTLVMVVLLGACGDPTEPDDRWADPEQIEYAASLGIELAAMTLAPSGLYWRDLVVGAGDTAQVGSTVRLRTRVWLPDATFVGEETRSLEVGVGLAIRGIDEGAVGMRVGGVRQLVVRPSLAFGRSGRPADGIPPLTTLVIELERLTPL